MGWNKNTLIPRRETAKAAPKVSNWYSFHLIGLGNVYWTFCFSGGNPPFWKLENALSLKGTLQNRTQWGPFDSLSILLGLGNVYWTSRFRIGNPPFWNLENVLFGPNAFRTTFRTAFRTAFCTAFRTAFRTGSSKVSFNFLHTLWVYRLCKCLLVYEIKIVTNILMGFKISCQVGGRGQKFQNYSR